eukprot:4700015-Pyramimonas_sp.AAC.1
MSVGYTLVSLGIHQGIHQGIRQGIHSPPPPLGASGAASPPRTTRGPPPRRWPRATPRRCPARPPPGSRCSPCSSQSRPPVQMPAAGANRMRRGGICQQPERIA